MPVRPGEFEGIVSAHYEHLYAFGLSLAGNAPDACELVQETFCRFAEKNSQIRDGTKVKTWLFTTLHREFLGWKRREQRLPHVDIDTCAGELPVVEPDFIRGLEAAEVLEALLMIEEHYRAALTLYYLDDCSYDEIAAILEVPIGTVMSRIARGKANIRAVLKTQADGSIKIYSLPNSRMRKEQR